MRGPGDIDLYLMESVDGADISYHGRSGAIARSTANPAGEAETITFTANADSAYGLVIVQQSGAGPYHLGLSATG